jgi:hypothetical protein
MTDHVPAYWYEALLQDRNQLRTENARLKTEVELLTKIIELEFARRLPRSEQMRKVHEIINSIRFGFESRRGKSGA